MVVFIDLDDPDEKGEVCGYDGHGHGGHGSRPFGMRGLLDPHTVRSLHDSSSNGFEQEEEDSEQEEDDENREYPNLNALSAILGCYPIISSIAKHLDLNSLHDLSRTCRQVRVNLLQHRKQLIPQTLRCSSETSALATAGKQGDVWNTHGIRVPRMTSGRIGACARDMVGECRRCGSVVCRNCTMKAPSSNALKSRHRRLCRTCIKAPLSAHTQTPHPESDTNDDSDTSPSHPHPPLHRSPCTCPTTVWLCFPCSTTLHPNDTSYTRAWTWRSRYSTHLHGLGTGIGLGIEGVQCGRESSCLASRTLFKEIECDVADTTRTGGYFLQEMEGIGGVVKKKVKRRVRVGAVVREYEDEREGGRYLEREQEGIDRSWCSWCARVVLSKKDAARFGNMHDGAGGDERDVLDRSLTESDMSSSSSL